MIDFSKFDSLLSVAEYFTTDCICKDALAEARWGDDVVCPYMQMWSFSVNCQLSIFSW